MSVTLNEYCQKDHFIVLLKVLKHSASKPVYLFIKDISFVLQTYTNEIK